MGKLSFLLNYEIDRKYEHADIGDGRLHIPLLEGAHNLSPFWRGQGEDHTISKSKSHPKS